MRGVAPSDFEGVSKVRLGKGETCTIQMIPIRVFCGGHIIWRTKMTAAEYENMTRAIPSDDTIGDHWDGEGDRQQFIDAMKVQLKAMQKELWNKYVVEKYVAAEEDIQLYYLDMTE